MTPREYRLYLNTPLKLSLAVLALVSVGAPLFVFFVLHDGTMFPWPVVCIFPLVLLIPWYFVLTTPYRIVVSEDQRLEFVTFLRRRTVTASDIRSIKPTGNNPGYLAVRYQTGTIHIVNQFTGFHHLLTELERVNPSIQCIGC